MTFGQAIATCFRKYADFTGRAGRPEYWWFALFAALVSFALNIVSSTTSLGLLSLPLINSYSYHSYAGVASVNVLTNLWSLAILLPSLAVAVRRLRDSGRSWGNLFWVLLPFVGVIILIVQLCQPSIAQTTTSPLPVPPPPPPGMPAV